jgi:Ca2+-binding EF-hand superfamily protein
VTVTQVVEKRTQRSGNTSVSPNKPGTQVVNTRSQKTVTTSVSPNKPSTQVVNTRSHQATISTSGSPTKPGTHQVTSNRQTTSVSPNKPGTHVVDKRSHQTVTTSVSPGKPGTTQVTNQRSHKPATTYVNPTKNVPQMQVVDKRGQKSSSKPASNAPSKPASKAPSQAPTKKVEIKKVVYDSDGDKIKEAFELFDSYEGRINAKEVREAMQNIGYDEKNPQFYQVVTELDNPRNKNSGGFTFEDFCQTVNNRMPEKETDDDLREIFELFIDDPDSGTTSLESIKRVADELGENFDENELNAMLNKASKAGARLTFDDFVAIMKNNF